MPGEIMALELSKVIGQIHQMGQELAARARQERTLSPTARDWLRRFAHRQEELRQIAASEEGRRVRCASPGDEPLDMTRPAPTMPDHITLVAADGSQIYPDRHGIALYYVINIGTIVFRHGSQRAPEVATNPRLFYTDDQVFPGGELVSGDLVSVERNLAEIQVLTDLALSVSDGDIPCIALMDGPLLIWLQRTNVPQERQARILNDYLACLSRLHAGGLPIAGFVSRPFSAEVLNLLNVAQHLLEAPSGVRRPPEAEVRNLTDRALFNFLQPGERSALFVRGTATNEDFQAHGQTIYFFYLNTGADLARVEVPVWVAHHAEWLDLVHAAIYGQCRINNGYPYVLTRADEQAVILGEEREALEAMIGRAMASHGLPLPELSRKAQQKQKARWRKRR